MCRFMGKQNSFRQEKHGNRKEKENQLTTVGWLGFMPVSLFFERKIMKERKMESLGSATLTDRTRFLEWLKEEGWKRKAQIGVTLTDSWYCRHWRDYFYVRQELFRDTINIFDADAADSRFGQRATTEFFQMLDTLKEENQPLQYFYKDAFACIVGYSEKRYVMPSEWYEFSPLLDYSHLDAQTFKAIGGSVAGSALPATLNGLTQSDVKDRIDAAGSEMEELEKQKQEIEACESTELKALKEQMEALRAQMEEQKRELLKDWMKKKEELDLKRQELEKTLFLLETQIYGIRCYLGEVIHVHWILNGPPAPVDTPVILYQKIRYLDEELGKYASLYQFDGSEGDKQSFLSLLKHREDIRNLFVPNDRCITLLRVSRTGIQYQMSDVVANTLETYKTYHGRQLALLMRDGGRLSIAWLDDEKISLSDENAFYQPGRKEEREYQEGYTEQSTSKEEVASRYFLLSILQGITDNGTVFKLPEKINVMDPHQKYFIFSMADGWIADHTYGTFDELLDRVSKIPMKEGDMVLTAMVITRDDRYQHDQYGRASRYERYNNDRGIGERNRTHDATIPGFTILPINKVLYDLTVEYAYEKFKGVPYEEPHSGSISHKIQETGISLGHDSEIEEWDWESYNSFLLKKRLSSACKDDELLALQQSYGSRDHFYYKTDKGMVRAFYHYDFEDGEYPEIWKKEYTGAKLIKKVPHYFLSAEKEANWETGKAARANMEVESDEIIPLTYLCETWIRYVITTGNVGNWRVGGKILSYAEALRYLNKILEYIRKRDQEIPATLKEAGLEKWMQAHPDWDVLLTEWRIANQIRNMTFYQVKRFAKSIAADSENK